MTRAAGQIHIGIGGRVFEPWRGTFYRASSRRTRRASPISMRPPGGLDKIDIATASFKVRRSSAGGGCAGPPPSNCSRLIR
jgi:hypothetical protein